MSMKIVVGLGNIWDKYESTRHNLGFTGVDQLLEKLEPVKTTFWEEEKKLKAQIKQIKYGNDTLLLAKPTTFMNNSGEAYVYQIDEQGKVIGKEIRGENPMKGKVWN